MTSTSSRWSITPEVKKEFKEIFYLALPVVATNALLMLLQIEDQIVLGHLGDDELAASALGNTVYNLAWFYMAGAASACDTFIAQAWGARDYAATEYWTRMGYLVMTLLCIPAFIIFQYSEWIVRNLFRQEEHIAHMAGRYTQLLSPGLPFISYFIVQQKSLQARGILMPCVWIMLLSNVLNLLGNWFFVFQLDMGFTGSPIATSTSRFITFVITSIYYYGFQNNKTTELAQGHSYSGDLRGEEPVDILQEDGGDLSEPLLTNNGSSSNGTAASAGGNGGGKEAAPAAAAAKLSFREAFCRFLALALPGGIMVGLEAWSFDWTLPMAAHFGTLAVDAHQSMMSISAFTYLTIPLAISIAASIRVGNLLGAQRPKQAHLAARICIFLGVACMVVFSILIITLRYQLGKIFSNDPEVIHIVSNLCPLLALYQVLDGYQGCSAGSLRGAGRQSLIAGLNLLGFWVLGLPIGYALSYHTSLHLYGLWWGFCAGLLCTSALYMFTFARVDWDLEAKRALNSVTDLKLEHAWEEENLRRLSTSSSSPCEEEGRKSSIIASPSSS